MIRTWLFPTLAAVGFAAQLAAQQEEIPPKFELSPFGGVFIGATLYNNAAGQPIKVVSKPTYGGRLAWNVSPTFALEASWARTVSTLVAPSTTLPGTQDRAGSVTLNQFDLSALLAYASPREAIHFALGLGFARLTPEITGATAGTDTRPLVVAGIGYERFLGGPVGFRTELRYHGILTNRATDIGILCGGTTGCYVYQTKKFFSSAELTAGLAVRL